MLLPAGKDTDKTGEAMLGKQGTRCGEWKAPVHRGRRGLKEISIVIHEDRYFDTVCRF